MGITSGLVLFSVIWFMVFFVMLPLRLTTQGEAGEVVPGTHVSAPSNPQLGRKAIITTVVAVLIWGLCTTVILSEWISLEDLESFHHLVAPSRR